MKMLYKSTNVKTGDVNWHQNIKILAAFIKTSHSNARKHVRSGKVINYLIVEQLDEPVEIEMPVKNEVVTIEGQKCTVINSYDKTFSVRLADGSARLVKYTTMKFVENNGDVYPRNHLIGAVRM